MEIIDDIRPDITAEKVCRLLGRGKTEKRSARTVKKIKRFINDSYGIIEPMVLCTEKRIDAARDGSLMLKSDISLDSSNLTRSLRKCKRIAVFLATIGRGMERKVNSLINDRRMADAYIYDSIGSVAVEETVEKFQTAVECDAHENKERTTLRFSPGYCDWNVREQRKIFTLLDSDSINVKLTAGCLMTPRKSVSGVFGIGSVEELGERHANPCRSCDLHGCIARRE
jgi:hypothetical protein